MSADTNDSSLTAGELADISRISVTEAHALLEAGRGVLVDTRDRRLYDNAHAAGAISLPLSEIQAAPGQAATLLPLDRVLVFYCA